MKLKPRYLLIVLFAVAANVLIKVILLVLGVFPFNSDEAVVGLMARHILAGEWPVFFYGQAYMGSLDAYLVALGFMVFGQAVWVIRLVQIVLYMLIIITTVWLGYLAFGSIQHGILASLFVALPPVNVILYSTVSLGGYGEALLLGNLILGIALISGKWVVLPERAGIFSSLSLSLGFFIGLGLWANALTMVYALPAVLFHLWKMYSPKRAWTAFIRALVWLVLGGIVGALPWIIFGYQNGFSQLIYEILGKAVAVEQGDWVTVLGSHLFNLVVLGGTVLIGLRPSWQIRWLALPLAPFVLAFWIGVVIFWIKKCRQVWRFQSVYLLLAGIPVVLSIAFVFTAFGVDPSGRYFLPLTVPMGLVAAGGIMHAPVKKILRVGAVMIVLAANIWGVVESTVTSTAGITTQFDSETIIDHRQTLRLIDFLEKEDIHNGYSTYWVSYPVAFLTSEKIILSPRLPYHKDMRYTSRDDRYLPYTNRVLNSDRIAYITYDHAVLDDRLRNFFKETQLSWLENRIGSFTVFYNFSSPIHFNELKIQDE